MRGPLCFRKANVKQHLVELSISNAIAQLAGLKLADDDPSFSTFLKYGIRRTGYTGKKQFQNLVSAPKVRAEYFVPARV
jgi:hypothetical protein